MEDRRQVQRSRMLRGGKILLHRRSSVINCTVRNLSPEGACLQVDTVVGIPFSFDLAVDGEPDIRPCRVIWQSETRLGVSFQSGAAEATETALEPGQAPEPIRNSGPRAAADPAAGDLVRGEMLRLRTALDHVKFGVVLLDQEMRAQFINRAFRQMWRLSDAKADSKPAFVALMYHGRDTRAYEVSEDDLDGYVAARVAHVKSGDPTPRDLRLTSGEVLRFQCTTLPYGGRLLSYTYVTDIVQQRDELAALRAAFDTIPQGVMLLDAQLNTQFMNHTVRERWGISNEDAARKPSISELLAKTSFTRIYGVAPEQREAFITDRLAWIRRGDPQPVEIRTGDGRTVRAQCTVLPGGGRMLTYTDVTDLVSNAATMEHLATIDGLTGAYNRRHFLTLAEAEWSRFHRYHRPLSLLMLDIDNFKPINDQYGHAAGDQALLRLCDLCNQTRRTSDILARLGGDEFALLLPETDLAQATVVAERLRVAVEAAPIAIDGAAIPITTSIGVAESRLAQSGFDALLKAADQALYRCKARGRNQVGLALVEQPPGYRTAAE
jgi:diguanylate cyclase (GGDEF)-like protein